MMSDYTFKHLEVTIFMVNLIFHFTDNKLRTRRSTKNNNDSRH